MSPLFSFFVTTLLSITLSSSASWARDWSIDQEQSRLTFEADQFGTGFTGEISTYDARIFFDPENLDATKVAVEIDVTSITTGDAQRDISIRGLEWFAMEEFPQAQFISNSAKHLGGTRYELDGTLTIKGMSQDVTMEFDFIIENDQANVKGDMIVLRNDYKIGEGQFSVAQVAALEVKVHIELQATPTP